MFHLLPLTSKKTIEATALIASNNNDILINTDELLKENYFIKNDISELIKTKNKPFKKIRAIKEIIKSTDGDDEGKRQLQKELYFKLIGSRVRNNAQWKNRLGYFTIITFCCRNIRCILDFWNTSIHTIFPILISVFAYLWSGMSGYNNYDPFVKNLNKNETSISAEMEVL